MAGEEAVLRIVVQDEGARAFEAEGPAAAQTQPRPFSGPVDLPAAQPRRIEPPSETPAWQAKKIQPDDPMDEAEAIDNATRKFAETFSKASRSRTPGGDGASQDASYAPKIEPDEGPAPFDPVAAAKKRLDREKQLQQIQAEYDKLTGGPAAEPTFDPVAEAKRRFEKEKRLREIEAEYDKLSGGPPKFDPVAEAQKRLDHERRKQQIEEEYGRLNPPKPEAAFDPMLEARKRMDKGNQEKMVEEAAQQIKLQESMMGRIMGKALGPSLGGAAAQAIGTVIGAQLTSEGGKRLAAGAAYGGAAGATRAFAANTLNGIMENDPFIGKALSFITEAFATRLQLQVQKISDETEYNSASIRGDAFRAEIIQNRQMIRQYEEELGAARFLNSNYHQLVRDTKAKEQSYQQQQDIAGRAGRIAPFSPQMTQAQMQGEAQAQRRNFAEGALLGDRYAQFINNQNEIDRLSQTVKAFEQLPTLLGEIRNQNATIARLQEVIKEKAEADSKRIDAEAAERKKAAKNDDERLAIEKERLEMQRHRRDLAEGRGKTAMDEFLEGIQLPRDEHDFAGDTQARQAQAQSPLGMGAFDF